MKFIDDIVFVKKTDAYYDPEPGKWVEGDPEKTETTANVTDLGTNRSVELFGELKKGAKVIRLQRLFNLPEWDHVLIDDQKYILTTDRQPLNQHTLIVEEVAANG